MCVCVCVCVRNLWKVGLIKNLTPIQMQCFVHFIASNFFRQEPF